MCSQEAAAVPPSRWLSENKHSESASSSEFSFLGREAGLTPPCLPHEPHSNTATTYTSKYLLPPGSSQASLNHLVCRLQLKQEKFLFFLKQSLHSPCSLHHMKSWAALITPGCLVVVPGPSSSCTSFSHLEKVAEATLGCTA